MSGKTLCVWQGVKVANEPIQGMFHSKKQTEAWLQILTFSVSKGKRGMYNRMSKCFIVLGWEVAYLLKIMCRGGKENICKKRYIL